MAIDDYELKMLRIKSEIKSGDIKLSMNKAGKLGPRKVHEETNSPVNIKIISNEVLKNQKTMNKDH
jgi:hypothetical protein